MAVALASPTSGATLLNAPPPGAPVPRGSVNSPSGGAPEATLDSSLPPASELEADRSANFETRGRRGARDEDSNRAKARAEDAQERQEQSELRELKARDREVRAHEQAHASVGGQYAGAPSFTFVRGPDGVQYATGGEVPIDVSAVPGDPEATLRKMQIVQRAALAPVNPSSADRRIAAKAGQQQAEARAELAQVRAEERQENAQRPGTRGTDSEGDGASRRSGLDSRIQGTGALATAETPAPGQRINTAA